MKKSLSSFIALATLATMTAPLSAEILVGWNVFDPNDNASRVDDATPDTVASGFTGLLGTQVNPASIQGGGIKSADVDDNVENLTYGASYGIPAEDLGDPSGIILNTYSNNNAYCDFAVTNQSGADVTIDYIHIDVGLKFAPTGGTIKVSHFSAFSALADGFNNRALQVIDMPAGVWGFKEYDVSTAEMGDVILANGETAAFRLFLEKAAEDAIIVKVDNIAISTGPLPEPPAPKWAGYDIDENGIVDTGAWLGFLNVNYGDYVWSYTLETFLYLPESHAETAGGSWSYVYNY